MKLECEFSHPDKPLTVILVDIIEVDDCDAENCINDPSILSGELFCISAREWKPVAKKAKRSRSRAI